MMELGKGIRVKWLVTLVSFLVMILCNSHAQQEFSNLSFHHLSSSDGLSESTNSFIYKDSRGFIWISSLSGLNRYDGDQVKVYRVNHQDSTALQGGIITSPFFEDEQSDIWFTVYGALTRYDRDKDRFQTYRLQNSGGETLTEDYYAFHLDPSGNVWVRTGIDEQGTLHLYNIYEQKDSIIGALDGQRCQVIKDSKGSIIGISSSIFNARTGIVLTYFDPDGTLRKKHLFSKVEDPNFSNAVFWNGFSDSPRSLWYGTGSGVVQFDPETANYHLIHEFRGQPLGRVTSVVPIGDRYLLASTARQGILLIDRVMISVVRNFKADNKNVLSLRANNPNELYLDPDGCLWVSFWGQGIDFAQTGKNKFPVTIMVNAGSEIDASVLSIAEDDAGFVWCAAGAEGIFKYDQTGRLISRYFKKDSNRSGYRCNELYLDMKGRMWLLTFNPDKRSGIWLYEREKQDFVEKVTMDIVPTGLLMLRSERFLVPSSNGVYELQKDRSGNWNIVPSQDLQGRSIEYVVKAFEDSREQLYLSVNFNRIMIYHEVDDKLVFIKELPDLGNCRKYLEIPNRDRIWITSNNGLYRFDSKALEVSPFEEDENAPPVKNYYTLLADKDGHLWLKTNDELIHYDTETGSVDEFSFVDGIIENVLDEYSECLSRSGRMWFGGKGGFNVFHPEKIELLSVQANPQVTTIKVNDMAWDGDKSIPELTGIELPYRQNTISMEFVACEYSDPGTNEFQYKLEGYDKDWVDNGTLGFARYANLPSGDYVFKLKASNSDGVWSDEVSKFRLSIMPPWWDTWWARTSYFLAFIGLLWYLREIEVRKQKRKLALQEEKLAHQQKINEELRKVDQLKDQFLANTSHELRTPLNGIIGLTESLKDGIAGRLPAAAIENLEMIRTSGKRLATLVNDILDFTKLKNYDLELDLRPVDLHAATDVVMTLSGPLTKNKRLKLINRVPRDLPLVEADENRVQQILHNLIGNAIKFTDDGAITVSARGLEQEVEVTVADTGIGIPEEKLDNIFKSFEQIDGSEEREHGGTGLGLSVTRQLVELHKGTIRAESKENVGSRFIFTIPVSAMKRENVPESEPTYSEEAEQLVSHLQIEETEKSYPGGQDDENSLVNDLQAGPNKVQILVVDDEPVNLQVVKNHLVMAGYQVTECHSGIEAMELFDAGNIFDLVLLDVMMPRMSGYEVSRQIRQRYMASELPIILLTAKNRVSNLVEGFNAGANDYLTKPFSKDELLSRIKTHLNLYQIHKATGRFVPYKFLRSIDRKVITDVQVGDQAQKNVTVLFSDIRSYTTLAETMTPTENFRFVNAYVGRMGPIIQENDGFVNQYLGDGIMAIFPQKAEKCLRSAVEMQKEIRKYNLTRQRKGHKPIQVGMGLHTGPLIMGIIGDNVRSDTATIADTVNLASRMEGLTKYYGAKILFSESSLDQINRPEEFNYRYIGRIKVKGKEEVIKAYECIDGDEEALRDQKLETLEKFDKALQLFFNKEFLDSVLIFREILELPIQDPVVDYFYKKAALYVRDGVPTNWTGIEMMDLK